MLALTGLPGQVQSLSLPGLVKLEHVLKADAAKNHTGSRATLVLLGW